MIPDPEIQWFTLEEPIPVEKQFHSNEYTIGMDPDHYSFVVFGTDGLWDAMSNPAACLHINQLLKKSLFQRQVINGEVVQAVADNLMQKVRASTRTSKYAMDNTTIVVACFVPCDDEASYLQEYSDCVHCFQPSLSAKAGSITSSTAECKAHARKRNAHNRKKKNTKTKPKKNKPKAK